jgi:hypothetical protein
MTDRVRMRFGAPSAAEKIDDGGSFVLLDDRPGEGRFAWDLGQPLRALRPVTLFLHPLTAALRLVEKEGIESVVRRKEVPPLDTGFHLLSVSANLTETTRGALALGVTIDVPEKLPFRPQAVVETVELRPPDYEGEVRLRLSPGEDLEYNWTPYVVWKSGGRIQQLEATPRSCRSERLELAPDDFPVTLVSVRMTDALAGIVSRVEGTLRWKMHDACETLPFELSAGNPVVTLVHPKEAARATLDFVCWSEAGDRSVRISPVPAAHFTLGPQAFSEFGPQRIEIECRFPKRARLYAIDLLPEAASEAASEITTLHFTPDRPTREWSWYAASPFLPGYRYRRHPSDDETAEPWSEVQPPDRPLRLKAMTAT